MSSLQKFHRRTQTSGPAPFAFTTIGGGDATHGFWVATAGDGASKLIVAPLSTESNQPWGSYNTTRNTISTTDGISNTNTLYAFGNNVASGHPAAYYCKTLTTGGYNTWYLPAKDELNNCWTNNAVTPFKTSDGFTTSFFWTSTESSASNAWCQYMGVGYGGNGVQFGAYGKKNMGGGGGRVRAVRRVV